MYGAFFSTTYYERCDFSPRRVKLNEGTLVLQKVPFEIFALLTTVLRTMGGFVNDGLQKHSSLSLKSIKRGAKAQLKFVAEKHSSLSSCLESLFNGLCNVAHLSKIWQPKEEATQERILEY